MKIRNHISNSEVADLLFLVSCLLTCRTVQVSDITMFKNVPRSFVPVMWFENAADVPGDMIFKMKLLANLKVTGLQLTQRVHTVWLVNNKEPTTCGKRKHW